MDPALCMTKINHTFTFQRTSPLPNLKLRRTLIAWERVQDESHLEPLQDFKTILFSIVLDRTRPKSPKSRNREGRVLELGIDPPSGKPSWVTRRQRTLIRALSDQEQAASPPSPQRAHPALAQGEDPPFSPGSWQPRAVADPLRSARPADPLRSARPLRVA